MLQNVCMFKFIVIVFSRRVSTILSELCAVLLSMLTGDLSALSGTGITDPLSHLFLHDRRNDTCSLLEILINNSTLHDIDVVLTLTGKCKHKEMMSFIFCNVCIRFLCMIQPIFLSAMERHAMVATTTLNVRK
jgi:hypothetical protein